MIGSYYDDGPEEYTGSVYFYHWDGLNWVETEKIVSADADRYDRFGNSVSISDDRAIVGTLGADSVYVFDLAQQGWLESSKLSGSLGAINSFFGSSISISNERILVGAPGENSGVAYIFEKDGLNWRSTHKLTASDSKNNARFGSSVSLSGDYALIGSFSKSSYLFKWDGIQWVEMKILVPSNGNTNRFSATNSLSDSFAAVGHAGYNTNGNYAAVYIFKKVGEDWVESQILTSSDKSEDDRFGSSISLSGNHLLIGAFKDNDNDTESGSVYAFNWNGVNWVETQKLLASDGARKDVFGFSVSASGDRVLVGAFLDNVNGIIDSGSAYIFDWNGSSWIETQKLTGSDLASDFFGKSVSLFGNHALVLRLISLV